MADARRGWGINAHPRAAAGGYAPAAFKPPSVRAPAFQGREHPPHSERAQPLYRAAPPPAPPPLCGRGELQTSLAGGGPTSPAWTNPPAPSPSGRGLG